MASVDAQLIELYTQSVDMPNEGEDGYFPIAVVSSERRGWRYVAPEDLQSIGVAPAPHNANLWVAQSWGGSPVQPQIRYNQATLLAADTFSAFTIKKTSRQGQYTGDVSINSSDTGPITYNGPVAQRLQVSWSVQFRVVTNPSRVCYFGLKYNSESVPRAGARVDISGATGTRYNVLGRCVVKVSPGDTFWLGCIPYNGTLPADAIGIEELSFAVRSIGNATDEV